jgi:hypothetical protein
VGAFIQQSILNFVDSVSQIPFSTFNYRCIKISASPFAPQQMGRPFFYAGFKPRLIFYPLGCRLPVASPSAKFLRAVERLKKSPSPLCAVFLGIEMRLPSIYPV